MSTSLNGAHTIIVEKGCRPTFVPVSNVILHDFKEGVLDMEKQPSFKQLSAMNTGDVVDFFYCRIVKVMESGNQTYIDVIDPNTDLVKITLFGLLCENNPVTEDNSVIFFHLLVNQYNGELGLKMSGAYSSVFGVDKVTCCYLLC